MITIKSESELRALAAIVARDIITDCAVFADAIEILQIATTATLAARMALEYCTGVKCTDNPMVEKSTTALASMEARIYAEGNSQCSE